MYNPSIQDIAMKTVDEIFLPENCVYTARHVWCRQEGDEIVVGISDFAQDQLEEIVFVELPSVGSRFGKDEGFGTVESLKAVNTLHIPVDGEITAVNTDLEETPGLVNVDCYAQGWIIRIWPNQLRMLEALLTPAAYRGMLAE
jgi:glycine cleavage system H protein